VTTRDEPQGSLTMHVQVSGHRKTSRRGQCALQGSSTHRERLQHAADGGAVEVQRLADARVAGGHAELLPLHREGDVADETLQASVLSAFAFATVICSKSRTSC